MAIRPIVIVGDPVLHNPTRPVETFDDELKTLVADMFETMAAAPESASRRTRWASTCACSSTTVPTTRAGATAGS